MRHPVSGQTTRLSAVGFGPGPNAGQEAFIFYSGAPLPSPAASGVGCDAAGLCGRCGTPLLKALPAEDWATLSWPERYRGFLATLRADRRRFRPAMALATQHLVPFGLAGFTPLGLVLEALIGEEKLFPCGEDKIGPTIHTLHDPVPVFHTLLPWHDLRPAASKSRRGSRS